MFIFFFNLIILLALFLSYGVKIFHQAKLFDVSSYLYCLTFVLLGDAVHR